MRFCPMSLARRTYGSVTICPPSQSTKSHLRVSSTCPHDGRAGTAGRQHAVRPIPGAGGCRSCLERSDRRFYMRASRRVEVVRPWVSSRTVPNTVPLTSGNWTPMRAIAEATPAQTTARPARRPVAGRHHYLSKAGPQACTQPTSRRPVAGGSRSGRGCTSVIHQFPGGDARYFNAGRNRPLLSV